jgi:small subunit ribosomal protein S5
MTTKKSPKKEGQVVEVKAVEAKTESVVEAPSEPQVENIKVQEKSSDGTSEAVKASSSEGKQAQGAPSQETRGSARDTGDRRHSGPRDRRPESEGGDDEPELIETVVRISRVSKVVKGGRRFSFSTISVVGDGKGRVGVGLGKANEVPGSIQKSFAAAKRNMIKTVMLDGTLPYEVEAKAGAGRVFLKPAAAGTGVIAGGSVRAVVEAAGYKNILSKSLGSNNPVNVLRATMKALGSLKSLKSICRLRDKTPDEVFHRSET